LQLLHAHTALTRPPVTCMPMPTGPSAAQSLPDFKLALVQGCSTRQKAP